MTQGQPGLLSKFKAGKSNIVKLVSKRTNKNKAYIAKCCKKRVHRTPLLLVQRSTEQLLSCQMLALFIHITYVYAL